jgi:ATP-dependent Clp protease ATP-binding subunit ClpA
MKRQINRTLEPNKKRRLCTNNIVHIKKHFTDKLVGQDTTFKKLASILYPFNQRKIEKDVKRILPLVFSGVSGTGKTESTKLLRTLYEIESDQYIYVDLSRIATELDYSIIMGAAPGLSGSTTRYSIPMRLLRSIGRAPKSKLDLDETENEYNKRRRDQDNNAPSPPDTILLHLDELDKAHNSFMTLLINFIETGCLSSSASNEFILPDETQLIIVFTANFGADVIETMTPDKQYTQAQEAIRRSMEENGIHRAILGRLEHILPFFRLDNSVINDVKRQKIRQILDDDNHAYSDYFTKFRYNEEVVDAVASILDFDDTLGMRALNGALNTFKQDLCGDITTNLIEYYNYSYPLEPDYLVMRVETFNHEVLSSMIKKTPHLFSQTVMIRVEECVNHKSCINLLTIRYKANLLTCFVSNIASTAVKCHHCGELFSKQYNKYTYQSITIVGGNIIFKLSPICSMCNKDS